MNHIATTRSGLPPPSHPLQPPSVSPPATELLLLLQILLVYARHLLGLLRQAAGQACAYLAQRCRATQDGFLLAMLTRGILRAIALEHVLLAHAGGEPDPDRNPRKRTAPAAPPSGPRPPHSIHGQRSGLPSLRQLEAAIRRQPVEQAVADIRHDLGLCFSLCEARFGNALRDMAAAYRDTLCTAFGFRRPDMDSADAPERNSRFALPPQIQDAIRYILGCFGVQQPVCGFPFTIPLLGAASAGAQPP